MGGYPKALLRDATTGETLLARVIRAARAADLEPVLVGGATVAGLRAAEPACRDLVVIADAAADAGPLAGIVGLLREVVTSGDGGASAAVVVACDMPAVDEATLRTLASREPDAPILAARRDGRWEPLLARYDARVLGLAEARLARGQGALQGLLEEAGACALQSLAGALLDDVDTPEAARQAGLAPPLHPLPSGLP